MVKFVLEGGYNIVGKGENASPAFLVSHSIFKKPLFLRVIRTVNWIVKYGIYYDFNKVY